MAEPESSTQSDANAPPVTATDEPSATSDARPSPSKLSAADEAAGAMNAVVEVAEARPASASQPPAATARGRSSAKLEITSPLGDAQPLAAYELLAQSPRLGDLVAIASRVIGDAARGRAADWAFTAKVKAAAEEAKLSRSDAETRFGNVLDVLSTGGDGAAERALAAAIWAHAVAESPRSRTEDEDRLAVDILWLATHTAFDATTLLDRALGEDAGDLWAAIGVRLRRIERGRGGALGRGEALVACAALAGSTSPKAVALCAELASAVKDPILVRLLGTTTAVEDLRLEGELYPTPRGPIATTLLAFTGILFAVHVVRLVGRLALAYRRPAEVSFTSAGIRVKTRTVLLGRTLREREHVIPRGGLSRVAREVRFPRAGFYAGLLALALGSYVGVRAFVDGVRSASPSLLVVGLVIVILGVGADFILGTLIPGGSGHCRITFVPRAGRSLCVGGIDPRRADDALSRSLAKG